MAEIINHDLRSNNGGTIYMPRYYRGQEGWGNLALPDVYAATTVQNWPCGTVYREGDRTFIYTKMESTVASSSGLSAGYLLRTKATYASTGDGVQSGAADSTTVVVNTGGAHAVDKYSGGTLGVYGASTAYGSRFIVSQDVADTSTAVNYDMTLVVDRGWDTALVTTDNTTLLENRYVQVNNYVTAEYAPYIGVICHNLIAASEYSWVQSGGPWGMVFYWGSATGAAGSGIVLHGYHGAFQALEAQGTDAVTGGVVGSSRQPVGVQLGYTESDMSGGMQVFLTIYN